MKRIYKWIVFTVIILSSFNLNAQTNLWKTEKTDDGKIIVKSTVSERVDAEGNAMPLVEYVATTTENVNMNSCIKIMKDASKHKEFMDVKTCERIKTISGNEWVNYYVFNAPWPFPTTDCVVKVVCSEDLKAKTAVFIMTAAPTLLKATDMKRFTYYNFTYAFKEVENGKAEITVTAKMALTVSVPLWMLRASFPSSASEPLQKLVKAVVSY